MFFYMIVTHMRSDEVRCGCRYHCGKEMQKLANKAAVANLYIGNRNDGKGDRKPGLCKFNGDLVPPEEIPARIEQIRAGMSPENAEHLTVNLWPDCRTPMGKINNVKQALQKPEYSCVSTIAQTDLKQ